MSYYTIAPSPGNPVNPGQGYATNVPGQNYERQNPLMQPLGGFRYRGVDKDELVQNQLSSLLNGNSDYIRQARSRGAGQALSRGLMNSSLAAGTAEGAAIEAGMPIAAQDAATFAKTHADNMDAENRALLAQLDASTQMQVAGQSAATQFSIAQLQAQLDKERLAQDQNRWQSEFNRDNSRYDTDWQRTQDLQRMQHQWDQEDWDRQNLANRQNYIGSSLLNTIFSDPSIWRDPVAASNFANLYGSNFNDIWSRVFPGNSPSSGGPR